MSATIYDVATRAGVSIATVSRALNAPQTVHGATLQRIQTAIDELGFVPKAEATARARRAHRQVGVLAPYFMHYPSFMQRMRGIAAALGDSGYELVVYNAETPAHVQGYLQSLPVLRRLDGLIVISLLLDDATVRRLQLHRLPTVVIEMAHEQLASVAVDNVGGGRLAAQYLTARGHRRIAFVGGDRTIPGYGIGTSQLRLSGFCEQLAEWELAPLLVDYEVNSATPELARQQAIDLLKRPERPTAIFAANDMLALGVLKAARELQLRVPEDVAVLGFDDTEYAAYIGLTTISQALEESGLLAVELLFSLITHPERVSRHVQVPLKIVERETA
jgi:DNA-binding LacI/PurR family transcriptional regulator